MLQIDIDLPRPRAIAILLGMAALMTWSIMERQEKTIVPMHASASVGGTERPAARTVALAEEEMRRLRLTQHVLANREQIMQAELDALQRELDRTADPAIRKDLAHIRSNLLVLHEDRLRAEQAIRASLEQIWEAQGYALRLSGEGAQAGGGVQFVWPVEPALGISAQFDDASYKKRFGIPHRAIDIPVIQGSIVRAAANGIVASVSDNGLGFNALIITHDGGYSTLYGHVSAFFVQEGQEVRAGEPVAKSGGLPGTPGAGSLTTGPHLHFELFKNGEHVDPLTVLP